ncbi:AraC family ligand binding domain-containing protein [Streptomyces sp. NPDC019890]|uniref:AraC family transcriptional regulator n=1 Tax=Streptomyces sp. NPDC019890 TaxID=3365064 RepID=UPI00384B075E
MAAERKDEWARHWQFPGVPGLDLLRARYVRHSFARHSHEGFVLGAVRRGIEDVIMPQGTIRARPGTVVMINPEVPHSAHAGVPEGWSYATLYPSSQLIADIAEEETTLRGTVGFAETIVDDEDTARLIAAVHRAAEEGNALAADSLLRIAVVRLLRSHGQSLPARTPLAAGTRTAALARNLLEERMAEPPSLERLAHELGTSPFALLRAFKAAYGMPPHSWLTNARVRSARRLLEAGTAPAEAAAAVGFTDQPHLNRHFTRIVGVPPGAYQRERARTYKTGGGAPT